MTYVYVGCSESQEIAVLRLDGQGALTPVETVRVPGPDKPAGSLPLAIVKDRKLLLAALRNAPFSILTYAVDAATGRLTYVGGGPLPDSMCFIDVDASGRYLASASYGGSKVAMSPIGANGVVGEATQVIDTLPKAHCIRFDASNRYVLHTSLDGGVVYQQRFDAATGRLTPNTPDTVAVTEKGGPRHLVISPDARFVYVMNELDAFIHVFGWDAARGVTTGAVQTITTLPEGFSGTPWGADIQVTPDGRYLYASERATHTLAAFEIDTASGRLKPVGNYPTEKQPRGFAIDPTGRFVIAAGQLSHAVTVHAIDANTGALAPLKSYPVGRDPNWIEIVSF